MITPTEQTDTTGAGRGEHAQADQRGARVESASQSR